METIEDNGCIVAIIYRDSDWVEGLNFITPGELNIQVSSWHYQEGKKLASHVHKDFERVVARTHEMTYVKRGSMKVLLYDEARRLLRELVLYAGDLAVYAYGGHGYEILEDNTQIVEAKTGPFVDVSHDKVKFD
jgi:hypothetical protein